MNVGNHTDLKGGIITSSAKAETDGKNRFQTATLNQSDIRNHSRYDADGFGIGVSGSISGQTLGQKAPTADSDIQTIADKNGIGSTLGYGSDGDNRSSVTRSGIGTRNIVIGSDSDGTQAASVYTATRSETAEANSGRLNNAFDKEQVQNEIDLQRNVSQDFSRNVQEVKSELNRHIADLDARKEAGFISNEEYEKQLAKYDTLKLLTDTVSMGLATPSDSLSGSLLAAATPAVSREIGDYFKKLDPETGKDRQGTPAHLAAHMVWNAAVAYATGNNTAAAALSAGSAEAAAPVISDWLFNQKDPAKLDEEQKAALANITGLLGSGIGAATGDYRNAVSDGLIGQTVTEHNNTAQVGKVVGGAGIAALGCLFDKNCGSVLDKVAETLAEQRKQAQAEQEAIFAAIQNAQKGDKKAQPKPQQQVSQAATGAPMPPDDEDEKKSPYENAKNGGKHSGFYKQHEKLSTSEIQKGINSLEKQIDIHNKLIRNPEKMMKELNKGDWKRLDPRQQNALINKKWLSDISRQMEQKNILEGILKQRGAK